MYNITEVFKHDILEKETLLSNELPVSHSFAIPCEIKFNPLLTK